MRRVLAPLTSLAFLIAAALGAVAQVNPPVPPPSAGPVNPPGSVATPMPAQPVPATESPNTAPSPGAPASPGAETPLPTATPTQPPIVIEPPQVAVEPGKTVAARVNGSLGALTATVADPSVATVVVDQAQRVVYVSGVKVGSTTVSVTDSRGVTRDVPVRVAYAAGTVAEETTLRVTGNPSSADYLREAVADAVERAATLRPGVTLALSPDRVPIHGDLKIDNRIAVDVPVHIEGNGYLPVNGVTHVVVENTALPPIQPARLLVSDYPERLTANGVLFTARLDRAQAQRFLYYHYNPGNEPGRRILLKAHNASNAWGMVQLIEGSAGPGANEMEVGHLSTKRFLVREARNEGRVVPIAPGATVNLVDHPLPAQAVVSAILQLRLVTGDPLDLTLVAQDAAAPTDQSIDTTQLLAGGAPHARGVYPVPTFFFDRTYDVDGEDLEIAIGQLPLPNLRQGEALSGDYGVEQSMSVVIVNMTRAPRAIALYANPRGGRATGTFIVDGTLVQAHALAAFSKFKIWQERINAGTFRRIKIVTMPEGGSSYPLRLIFAPDDGSVPPGAPGSPIY
ncbi:MAG TPA: pilus assembly protein N-terminal domain-containing protein [Candidatus Elarobacter sp.]